MLPCNSKSKSIGTKLSHLATKVWTALTPNDLKDIAQKVKEKFKWDHKPCRFKLNAIVAQLKCKDVLIHAGTGSGKTAVAAGPHAHEKMKGKVTFMTSLLIALQNEQVSKTTGNHLQCSFSDPSQVKTFCDEFNLEAVAVNSVQQKLWL